MTLEALLSYAHILAILTAVVFISSETALCRIEWMNERVVERLVIVDRIYLVGLVLVLVTGLARIIWGMKGAPWYWGNGLLHLKLGLFLVVVVLAIKPAALFRRWRRQLHETGALPGEVEIRQARRQGMMAAHLVAVIPLAAVFLARGYGSFR
jgi:putative membrane protein